MLIAIKIVGITRKLIRKYYGYDIPYTSLRMKKREGEGGAKEKATAEIIYRGDKDAFNSQYLSMRRTNECVYFIEI